jgi:hypothetical protein
MWHFLLRRDWVYLGYASGQALILWTPVWSVWWIVGAGLLVVIMCHIGMYLWKS